MPTVIDKYISNMDIHLINSNTLLSQRLLPTVRLLLLFLLLLKPTYGEVTLFTDTGQINHVITVQGQQLTLACLSTRHDDVITWTHNDTSVTSDLRRHVEVVTSSDPESLRNRRRGLGVGASVPVADGARQVSQLRIIKVEAGDSGTYICREKHSHSYRQGAGLSERFRPTDEEMREDRTSARINVIVVSGSVVTDGLQNYNSHVQIVEPPAQPATQQVNQTREPLIVKPGRHFTLKCTGHRLASLRWLHNNSILQTAARLRITTSIDISRDLMTSLLTRDVTRPSRDGVYKEEGEYRCADVRRQGVDRTSEGRHGVEGDSDAVNVTVLTETGRQDRGTESGGNVEIVEPISSVHRVSLGHNIELKCSGPPNARLHWTHPSHGKLTSSNGDVFVIEALDREMGVALSILRVERSKAHDSGKYTCTDGRERRRKEGAEDSVTVIVGDNFEDNSNEPMTAILVTIEMRVGSVVSLHCSLPATDSHDPVWMKAGKILFSDDKYVVNGASAPGSLVIRNADRSDADLYRCIVRHRSRTKVGGVVIFNVTAVQCPPLRAPLHGNLLSCPSSPVYGDVCNVECNRGYELLGSRRTECIIEEGDSPTGRAYWSDILPLCVEPSQYGEGENSRRGGEREVAQDLYDVPSSLTPVTLRAGEDLALPCQGSEIIWTYNAKPLNQGSKYSIDEKRLTLHKPGVKDVGTYQCEISSNSTPVARYIYNVSVIHCPILSPPYGGTVEGCGQVAIYGETCIIKCQAGLILSGSRSRSCELLGNTAMAYWTGQSTTCTGASQSWKKSLMTSTGHEISPSNIPFCFLTLISLLLHRDLLQFL